MEEILRKFSEVVRDPFSYGRNLKAASGKKMVGYVCTYVPEEIILAANAHPFRLFGTTGEMGKADAHLQAYCCSLVRGIMEEGLRGGTDFLDGIVFPHTCDSIQRLSDLWRMNVTAGFHLDAVLPVKLDTESARRYFVEVLGRLRRDLERELAVTIGDEELWRAVALMNELRANLRRIYDLRNDNPALLTSDALYTAVKAAMIMDRQEGNAMLAELAQAMAASPEKSPVAAVADRNGAAAAGKQQPIRLVMAGGICNHPRIHHFIEDAGGAVVWDDLCTGSRYFETPVAGDNDPLEAIAARFVNRAVCPAKHAGLTSRAENLVSLVKGKNARGVVFLLLKFCDPHAFDYPYLKTALDREGIPSLLLEVEDPLPAEGQLHTRFEAFLEML